MNAVLSFDIRSVARRPLHWIVIIALLAFGVFSGSNFNLSVGEGVLLNSPYTIGFMTGLLSLAIIFIATIAANQLLFKELDNHVSAIIFALPVTKFSFLKGRFLSFYLITFVCFVVLMTGFSIGQVLRGGTSIGPGFHLWHYLYPALAFGLFNALLVCSFLFLLAFITRKKLLVITGGLMLYVAYMVVLLFSNSPFMAASLPQSLEAQQISALVDPFGLSSYFLDSRDFTVVRRNTDIVPFAGYLLINRLGYALLSVGFLLVAYFRFSFSSFSSREGLQKKNTGASLPATFDTTGFHFSDTNFGASSELKSVLSFAKKDITYLFKSISLFAVSLLLLFCCGMEMYAEIEKGIRIPQKYAGSGLMATTIIENYHLFGTLLLVYFINDLFWRSKSSGFSLIENATYFSTTKVKGHFLAISGLLLFFAALLIAEGLLFQAAYHYLFIDWKAYAGIFLFAVLPLLLFSALLLWINELARYKFLAIAISLAAALLCFGSISQKLLPNPLFRIFSTYPGTYSDFNGFGFYTLSFVYRLIFGACLLFLTWNVTHFFRKRLPRTAIIMSIGLLVVVGFFSGSAFLEGYQPKSENEEMERSARYEKRYKKYELLPQPVITHVKTKIDLFPSANTYVVEGAYTLENFTGQTISKLLVNFSPDLEMESAVLDVSGKEIRLHHPVSEVSLEKTPLQPNEKAQLFFKIRYKSFAVNNHHSLNAIIENGSFSRLSRYFPSIGYQASNEVQDEDQRMKLGLTKLPPLKAPNAPPVSMRDFIHLDMTVSTDEHQTVIGTGDLQRQWKQGHRNYFQFVADKIPFRFAIASAEYAVKSLVHRGIFIHVYYHPNHGENVDHLIHNAKLTLDYGIKNFGAYASRSISFAEVSSFTKGFAATAYPSAIFMTEDMVFHANISGDKQQDVINELAGHELAHLWWGNSSINPDDREGASMLTETLAMYTEMMLYKKMYGNKAMKERVKMQQQIYDSEKGFSENLPLYRVTSDAAHISYSKGAVAMVRLSELIGEENVNKALNNFLKNNAYPKKPSSEDLLEEFYRISPENRKEIDRLFRS